MRTKDKGPRTIRIICIGGSTTEQPVQSTEDIWSGILEQKLNQVMSKRNIRVEVAAWGHGGAKVWDGYSYCKYKLLEFQPDIVVTLWGVNDISWHRGPNYSYEGKEKRMAKIKNALEVGWKADFKKMARKYSQIYRRLIRMQKPRFDKNPKSIQKIRDEGADKYLSYQHLEYLRWPFKQEIVADPDPMIEFTDGLREMLLSLKEQQIKTIVLGQPVLWKREMSPAEKSVLWFGVNTKEGFVRPSGQWFENEMSRYNQVQEKLAETYHLSYVPLDSLIPKSLDIFYDDCHFTDKGNRVVAEVIYPVLWKFVEEVAKKKHLTA